MTDLRTAARQALEAAEQGATVSSICILRAALAQEPQTTHSDECWRWHHACAVAKIEREQAPLGAWQPIETAPRDGTWVLLAGGYCDNEDAGDNTRRVVSGQWTDYLNGRTDKLYGRWQFAWYDGGYFGEYGGPTHWMPMPMPEQAEPTIPLFVGRRSALEKDK